MQYFSGCYTIDQAKAEYRRLARIHHPDVGGDVRTMQEIDAQYEDYQKNGNCWNVLNYTAKAYQQQPQAKPKKSRKPRKTKIYTVGAVQRAIDDANAKCGNVRYYDSVIVIESPGLKTVVAIPTERNGVIYYTIRQYNVTPKKYEA
ncbi:hypothetical protein D5272_01640 [bacterium D16-76]|nr:hypothetical protein [bacterium D16-76]